MHNVICHLPYSLLNMIAKLLVELILCTVLPAWFFHWDCYSGLTGLSIDKSILWTLCSSPFGYDTTPSMQNSSSVNQEHITMLVLWERASTSSRYTSSAMCLLDWFHYNWLRWSFWCATLSVSMAYAFSVGHWQMLHEGTTFSFGMTCKVTVTLTLSSATKPCVAWGIIFGTWLLSLWY